MTREKALNFLYKKIKSYSGKIETNRELVDLIEVDELINKIYNDFENRICKNCKWFDGKMYCLNEENDTYNKILNFRLLRKISKNSTCEKFEKK